MNSKNRDDVLKIVDGSYDLHIHPDPDAMRREFDDYKLVQDLDSVNMAGAIIKHHGESTCARATIANQYYNGKAKLYGSLTLNNAVGGLNPAAIENAVKMGVKLVWMPTKDAVHEQLFLEKPHKDPITILNEDGSLKPVVYEILKLIKENDLILATGHLDVQEICALCKEARRRDIKTVLTHPEYSRSIVPAEIQIELSKIGVIIEKMWLLVEGSLSDELLAERPDFTQFSQDYVFDSMRKIGAKNILLSSDGGILGHPLPSQIMCDFVAVLLDKGFAPRDVEIMACDVPAQLLGV